jgi:hypothetical protein
VISLLIHCHQHQPRLQSFCLSFPIPRVLRSMPSTLFTSARVQKRILSHGRRRIFSSLYATHGLHVRSHSVFVARWCVGKWRYLARMLDILHGLYRELYSLRRRCRGYWLAGGERWCSRWGFGLGWVIGSRRYGRCGRGIVACTLSLNS